MAYLYIAAAHKSSGKTSVSIGLTAAMVRKGLTVQPFKKGPDYIDPLWLARAAGRPCYNLDFFTQTRREIARTFATNLGSADIGLIEGNKGLFDGLALDGSDSNAALAASAALLVRDKARALLVLWSINLSGLLLGALAARMYYLQVIEADKYRLLADDNRINLRSVARTPWAPQTRLRKRTSPSIPISTRSAPAP